MSFLRDILNFKPILLLFCLYFYKKIYIYIKRGCQFLNEVSNFNESNRQVSLICHPMESNIHIVLMVQIRLNFSSENPDLRIISRWVQSVTIHGCRYYNRPWVRDGDAWVVVMAVMVVDDRPSTAVVSAWWRTGVVVAGECNGEEENKSSY